MGWLIAGGVWAGLGLFAWVLVRAGALADQRTERMRQEKQMVADLEKWMRERG